MKETFLTGRILLGGFLLFSGSNHLTHTAMMAEAAGHRGVPYPSIAVLVAGVLLIVAGASFLLGLAPKIGVAALVLFLVPVTLAMHPFWHESGAARVMDMVNFAKNVGLLGAVAMLAAIPEPWPYSVESRSRFHRHASV